MNPDAAQVPEAEGFRAELRGMSLFDVVQMECQRNAGRRALRIASGDSNRVDRARRKPDIHAQTDTASGEDAVLAILGLASGVVEETRPPFAVRETVRSTWQSLLLRAAHAADERQRSITIGEASSPRLRIAGANDEVSRPRAANDEEIRFDTLEEPTPMSLIRGRGVRLSPKGELVERRGEVRISRNAQLSSPDSATCSVPTSDSTDWSASTRCAGGIGCRWFGTRRASSLSRGRGSSRPKSSGRTCSRERSDPGRRAAFAP